MHFSTALLALLVPAALALPATSLDREELELVESRFSASSVEKIVDVQHVANGYLVSFNDPSLPMAEDEEPSLQRRCGSNIISCDYNHNRAMVPACEALSNILAENRNTALSFTITSRCFTFSDVATNPTCCTAWNKQVTGNRLGNMVSALSGVINTCKRNALVSGWATDVNLGGYCVRQCTSNRETCS